MASADQFAAFFRLPRVESPAPSPDGGRVAYLHDDTGRFEIHVLDAATGHTQRVTDGHLQGHPFGTDFLWTADGDGLYVSVVPEDDWYDASLYRFDLDGDAERLLDYTGRALLRDARPDGTVLFAARPRRSERFTLREFDEVDGERVRVADCWNAFDAAYSPGGERACVDLAFEAHERRNFVLEGEERTELTAGDLETAFVGWLDDRRAVYTVADGRAAGAVRDVLDDSVRLFGTDDPAQRPAAVVDGRVVCLDGEGVVLRDPGGGVERLAFDRAVTGVGADGGRLAAVLGATDEAPAALATWTADEGPRTRVQPAYGAVSPGDFVECERVTVEAAHGEYPVHVYRPGAEPAPVLVWVYGLTPAPGDHEVFEPAVQALVARGYAVAFPGSGAQSPGDVRPGDDSYALSDAEHEDVAAVGRRIAGRDWASGVAVLGHSHGAWSAAIQAVRYPDAWDAAVAWNGPTDLVAHYGANGRPPHYPTHLGPLDGNAAAWRDQSPTTHAGGLGTPLLLYHGASDRHVPLEQPRALRDHLRAWGYEQGRDFEYVEAPAEGHFSRAVEHQTRRWQCVLEFLGGRL